MKDSMLRTGSVLLAAAVVFVAAGCSEEEPGDPTLTGNPTSAAAPTGSPEPSAGGATGVESLDACSLFTEEDLASLGNAQDPKDEDLEGTVSSCRWSARTQDEPFTIAIAVRDNVGIDGLDDHGSGVQTGSISGSGRAYAMTSTDDTCYVALAVGDGARVDAVVAGALQPAACEIAAEAADILDPKLPEA